jgi:hypothetical protein
MLKVSHHLYQSASTLLVFSISAAVFWPYFAGAATLVIGLGTSIKNRIGQASGLAGAAFFFAEAMPHQSRIPSAFPKSSDPLSARSETLERPTLCHQARTLTFPRYFLVV